MYKQTFTCILFIHISASVFACEVSSDFKLVLYTIIAECIRSRKQERKRAKEYLGLTLARW